MTGFTLRNLRIFFRDKSAVFFSLLASFIIIGLYVLFLGDVWVSSFEKIPHIRQVMDNWIMAGLLAITSVTTTMGAFGTMINDKTRKIQKDLYAAPISRRSIAGGYGLSAFIIGLIISLVTLVLAQLYILWEGGNWMSLTTLFKVLGILLLSTFTNTSMVFFLTTFFASENAFSTASTVIGTLIGFITGIYLPTGNLPNAVQWVVKLFPSSHGAVLMRQAMMENAMNQSFSNIDDMTWFKEFAGVTFIFGDKIVSPLMSILFLLISGCVFFALAVFNVSRKKK